MELAWNSTSQLESEQGTTGLGCDVHQGEHASEVEQADREDEVQHDVDATEIWPSPGLVGEHADA